MAYLDGEGHQRAQLAFYLQMDRLQTLRFVHTLVAKGFAAEDKLEDQKVCRIFNRRIYRALGAEGIRHRRVASSEILFRRLLSLDYVLEHPGLAWLPTESEKVRAFEVLGIERQHLPLRVYRGAVGETRHYFPLKLPIALEPGRAVFVYIDPGYETATALRSWGVAHRGLWRASRGRDLRVEVVVVAIKQAFLTGNIPVLEEHGGVQAALKRSVELEQLARKRSHKTMIEGFATWGSTRIAGRGL